MENKKQNWAEIEDDDDDSSKSPQINQQEETTIEYKLQPTGESVKYEGSSRYQNKKPIVKKPLLSTEEMITQINTDKHYNVFLHCFGVSGNADNFKETFADKVKFVNLIETNNGDRDASIDLKFDDKEEAIKFIKLSQSTTVNGKNFRVKFGKLLKHGGEGFKKTDSYNRDSYNNKPRTTGGYEKREFRGNDRYPRNDNRENRDNFRENREPREQRDNREPREKRDNHEYRGHREHHERGEYKPHYKRDHHEKKQEDKPIERVEDATQQGTEQAPVEPAKRFGFTNSKKNQHTESSATTESIHCVDTNAKIVEKQKRDEQEKIAKQEEEKKLHPEGSATEQEKVEKVEKTEKTEKKEHHSHHNKDNKDNRGHHNNNNNNHHGKNRKEDGSKGKQQKTTGDNQKSEKVVYEKKESDKPAAQAPVEGQKTQQTTQKRDDDKSQGRKKLKLQDENKIVEDEWNIVPGKVTNDKKKDGDRKGGNNDNKRNNNNNNNNNNKKSNVTYARKDEQK